jgi:hypothetical protein
VQKSFTLYLNLTKCLLYTLHRINALYNVIKLLVLFVTIYCRHKNIKCINCVSLWRTASTTILLYWKGLKVETVVPILAAAFLNSNNWRCLSYITAQVKVLQYINSLPIYNDLYICMKLCASNKKDWNSCCTALLTYVASLAQWQSTGLVNQGSRVQSSQEANIFIVTQLQNIIYNI